MKTKEKNQIKYGALISYVLIIGNALFGLLVTPYVLRMLGNSAYGVYKSIGSFSSSMVILDLGIGGTLMRYIAKYRANLQDEKIGPFVSMMVCEAGVLLPMIALVEFVLYCQLDRLYAGSFSASELALAKQMYVILSVSVLFTIIENFLNGIITGYNNFVLGNGMKLLKLAARIILIFALLPINKSALFLVAISLMLSVAGTVVQLVYICFHHPIKLTFNRKMWEKGVLKESFTYTLLMFLTIASAQVNGELDNVIVGAFCGANQVVIYSFGLVIWKMFEQLSTSVSGVVLPTVSKIIVQDDWETKAQDFIVKIGRIQFILLGAAAVGFAVLGKEFISLWLGNGFEDVYLIVLILMVPSLFELCVNVCLAVLRAKNMLGFRTVVLVLSTVLNLVVSIAGIRLIGYFSAALGTAISFLVCSLLIMNGYYHKMFGFRMFHIYGRIMKGTWLCQIVAGAILLVTSHYWNGSWFAFAGNVIIFAMVYTGALLLCGSTKEEAGQIKKYLENEKWHRMINKIRTRFLLATQKTYGSNCIKYIFERHRDSDVLAVVFSGFSAPGEPAKYNYIRTLASLKINKLFVLDDFGCENRGSYYLTGRKQSDSLPQEICDLITHYQGGRRLVTAGSSKGGSAALLYGLRCGADAVIVGAPQYYIGDYLSSEQHKELLEGIYGNASEQSVKKLNEILSQEIDKADSLKTAFYIHCSPLEHTFEDHVKDLLEDLTAKGFEVHRDIDAQYTDHSKVGEYFSPYLQNMLGRIKRISCGTGE